MSQGTLQRLLRVLLGLALSWASRGEAQPCYTCRTEACPAQPGLRDWCGKGADPAATLLVVATTPPGAQVALSMGDRRRELGQTPLQHQLPSRGGPHALHLTLAGHRPVTLEVRLRPGRLPIHAQLEPVPTPAPAPVEATPAGADPPREPPGPQLLHVSVSWLHLPRPSPRVPRPVPLYRRWWLWTLTGGVAAAAVVTGIVVGLRPAWSMCPAGNDLCVGFNPEGPP